MPVVGRLPGKDWKGNGRQVKSQDSYLSALPLLLHISTLLVLLTAFASGQKLGSSVQTIWFPWKQQQQPFCRFVPVPNLCGKHKP